MDPHATPARASWGVSPGRSSRRRVPANAGEGRVLKRGVRRADPGRGPLLAARTLTEGTGVRSSTARNAPGGSVVCLGNEAPLLRGVQGARPPSRTLSPRASPCLRGHWEGLPPERAHPSLSQNPAGLCRLGRQRWIPSQ